MFVYAPVNAPAVADAVRREGGRSWVVRADAGVHGEIPAREHA
jgi:hypothetical protein